MSSLNTLQSDKTKILIVLKSFHSIMVPDRNLLWPNLNDLGALKLKLFHSTQNKLNWVDNICLKLHSRHISYESISFHECGSSFELGVANLICSLFLLDVYFSQWAFSLLTSNFNLKFYQNIYLEVFLKIWKLGCTFGLSTFLRNPTKTAYLFYTFNQTISRKITSLLKKFILSKIRFQRKWTVYSDFKFTSRTPAFDFVLLFMVTLALNFFWEEWTLNCRC